MVEGFTFVFVFTNDGTAVSIPTDNQWVLFGSDFNCTNYHECGVDTIAPPFRLTDDIFLRVVSVVSAPSLQLHEPSKMAEQGKSLEESSLLSSLFFLAQLSEAQRRLLSFSRKKKKVGNAVCSLSVCQLKKRPISQTTAPSPTARKHILYPPFPLFFRVFFIASAKNH